MREVTRTFGLIGIVLLLACSTAPAQAQGTAPAPAVTSTKPISKSSEGIRATIVGINIGDKSIIIQLAIANETKNRQHVFLVGNHRGALSTGDFLTVRDVVGIGFCTNNVSSDEDNVKLCLEQKSKDMDFYSYIEPGEYTTISLRFEPSNQPLKINQGNTFSFVVKFVVRRGPTESEALQEKAEGKTIGPPHVVTLNFPMIPLKTSE